MKNLILDCTLRDGGYCNKWEFGRNNIKKIIKGLDDANIDIIECGFLTNKIEYCENRSKYTDIAQLKNFIRKNKDVNSMLVVMVNCNEYDLNELPMNDGIIDGIRLAFHKKDIAKAMKDCSIIINKGYKLFVQPMVSINYSEEEFLELIRMVNSLRAYAFYIVDSFGVMNKNDLLKLFYLVEQNLDKNIYIGYHSHNNLQLAFSNAQFILNNYSRHNLIIDSSIFGMGRGAGNLNTELIVNYVDNFKYNLSPIFKIIDEVLMNFYKKNYWGYSLANYISAINNCHPNYAIYLENKNTLRVEDINNIFAMMNIDKMSVYDEKYIEKLYIKYLNSKDDFDITNLKEFEEQLEKREILVVCSGNSINVQKNKINTFIKEKNPIVICVNFANDSIPCDYMFFSNIRRYKKFSEKCLDKNKIIITSNINTDDYYLKLNYGELLNNVEYVKDNSALMFLKFLAKFKISKIYIAGLDGFSLNYDNNYYTEDLNFYYNKQQIEHINRGLKKGITKVSKVMNIISITDFNNIRW